MLIKLTNTLNSIVRRVLSIVKDGLKMWLPFENSEILGEDVIVNGDFATDSDWTKGTGWSISGGSANCNNTSGSTQDLETTNRLLNLGGKDIKITFTVSNYSGSASMSVTLEGTGETDFTGINANGTYSKVVTLGVNENSVDFFFKAANGWVGSIENVSLQEVTQIAPDKSGNSNGATLYTGKALSFDGANDYVNLGSQSMPNTSATTFVFWCNPTLTSSTGERAVIKYGRFTVWFQDNNEIHIYGNYNGSPSEFTSLPNPSGKYQRFVVTISGTTVKLYIDGTLIGSVTNYSTISTLATTSYIGQFNSNRFLPAKLSDVQLYDVAWTQADVTFDYDNPQHLVTDRAASSIALSNLKGYWHLSEGAGGVVYDSSGEDNDGTAYDGNANDHDNDGTVLGATWVLQQATIPQLGLMDWSKPTIGSDVVTLISDPNDPSEDILGNDVRLREHSLNLDGSGYAKVDSDSSLDIANYSIDGWVYSTNNSSGWEAILTKLTQDNFEVYIRNSQLRYFNSTDSEKLLSAITLNAWTYFCITESSGTLKCYINDDSTPKSSQTVTQKFANTGSVYIGSHQSGDYSNALIDDIRVYNGVLSADEVLQNYNAGLKQHKTGSAFSDDFSSDYGF